MFIIACFSGLVWGSVCCGIAVGKHRSGVGWFGAGFFFGLIGVLVAALVPARPDPLELAADVELEPAGGPTAYANWPPR